MPSLVLFGNRSLFGGDDLQPIAVASTFVRGLQILMLIPPCIYLIQDNDDCTISMWQNKSEVNWNDDLSSLNEDVFPEVLVAFVVLGLLSMVFSIFLESKIYKISCIGAPTEGHLRTQAKLNLFVELKLLGVPIIQSIVFIVGVISLHATRTSTRCKDTNIWKTFWFLDTCILVSSYAAELLLSLLGNLTIMLRKCMKQRKHVELDFRTDGEESLSSIHGTVENAWEDSCRNTCLCMARSTCFMFGGTDLQAGEYDQIARVLADYFEGLEGAHIDLVASDIVAGIVVLGKVQKQLALESIKRMRRQRDASFFIASSENRNFQNDLELSRSASTHSGPTVALLNPSEHHPRQSTIPESGIRQRNKSPSQSATNLTRLMDEHIYDFSDADDDLLLSFKRQKEGSNVWYDAFPRRPLIIDNNFDRALILEGAHLSRYALAIYTWMLYIYMKPCAGPLHLCASSCLHLIANRKSCRSSSTFENQERPRITGDNFCGVHENALLKHAGLEQSNLLYGQFDSSFTCTPYCIIVDHKWKFIVISIRGTLSLEDCVKDVLIEPSSLEDFAKQWGFCLDPKDQYVHNGVLQCTQWVVEDLDNHGIVDRFLEENTGYDLRICGHSLGAGIATLLSFVYRNKYPGCRCFSYSPPGGLLSKKLATECSEFVYSFVLDSDLVPRLAVQTMEVLRDEILELIARIRVPKIVIAESLFGDIIGNDSNHSLDWFLHPKHSIPDSPFKAQLDNLKYIQQRRKIEFRGPAIKLYPPGRIVHMVKVHEKQSCVHGLIKCLTCGTTNLGSEYIPLWERNDAFDEIVISPTMGTDHFPNRVCVELEKIATEMFGFDLTNDSQESVSQP